MFDLFVQRFLRNAWVSTYSTDFDEFKRLFNGINMAGNIESIFHEWFTALSRTDYVVFRTAYNLDAKQHPQVIVSLAEEPSELQPLGFYAEVADSGDTVFSTLVNQTAVVKIYGDTAEHVRVLHEFVRQAMMTSVRYFHNIGFTGVSYQSGADLEPDPEIMPELLGVYVRVQRWSTIFDASVTQAPGTTIDEIFVHTTDVTIDGITGGISPLEE